MMIKALAIRSLAAAAVAFASCAWADGEPHQPPQATSSEIKVEVTGRIDLDRTKHSPMLAEFEGSPSLTLRLKEALSAMGIESTNDRQTAKGVLILRGDLLVIGGSKFHHGARTSVGGAVESGLKSGSGPEFRGQSSVSVVSLGLNAAALSAATSTFTQGLAISRMVDALGDLGGARSWLNNLIAGDPRGICLSQCENWKKVKQTVDLRATLYSGESREDVSVRANAHSEVLMMDELLTAAVGGAFERVQLAQSRTEKLQDAAEALRLDK